MPTLLDSTVLVDVLRGRPGVLDRLRALRDAGEVPYVCAVNVQEVHRGLRPEQVAAAATVLLAFRPVPLGPMEGALAGTWEREFRARGITLGPADCLIAAAALSVGARLATGNPKHFPMPEVTVEHWPAGQ